jgi:hypothetical protein
MVGVLGRRKNVGSAFQGTANVPARKRELYIPVQSRFLVPRIPHIHKHRCGIWASSFHDTNVGNKRAAVKVGVSW